MRSLFRPRPLPRDPSWGDLGRFDRADGIDSPRRRLPLEQRIEHLTTAAMWRLQSGHGPQAVRAFLNDPTTSAIHGSDATAVVAVLIGDPR